MRSQEGRVMASKIANFESSINELESIVKQLEEGNLTLEKSLELFERGIKLSRFCHTRLEAAEQRIEILTTQGEITPAPKSLGEPNDGREK